MQTKHLLNILVGEDGTCNNARFFAYPVTPRKVADPHHFNADPDLVFHFNADPDPLKNESATSGLQTLQDFSVTLPASIVSVRDHPRLHLSF